MPAYLFVSYVQQNNIFFNHFRRKLLGIFYLTGTNKTLLVHIYTPYSQTMTTEL